MKVFENIMVGILVIVCLVGVGAGVAFFILTVMGFFEPLAIRY